MLKDVLAFLVSFICPRGTQVLLPLTNWDTDRDTDRDTETGTRTGTLTGTQAGIQTRTRADQDTGRLGHRQTGTQPDWDTDLPGHRQTRTQTATQTGTLLKNIWAKEHPLTPARLLKSERPIAYSDLRTKKNKRKPKENKQTL